jgi:hypothetical protein
MPLFNEFHKGNLPILALIFGFEVPSYISYIIAPVS